MPVVVPKGLQAVLAQLLRQPRGYQFLFPLLQIEAKFSVGQLADRLEVLLRESHAAVRISGGLRDRSLSPQTGSPAVEAINHPSSSRKSPRRRESGPRVHRPE